jgi:DNA topoisomerase VI subunit A
MHGSAPQVLKDNTSNREFNDQSQARAPGGARHARPDGLRGQQVNKTTVMTRILQLVHEICTKGIHVTKRDLFYTDVKLFEARAHACAACCALP